jgi:hypothetical protein
LKKIREFCLVQINVDVVIDVDNDQEAEACSIGAYFLDGKDPERIQEEVYLWLWDWLCRFDLGGYLIHISNGVWYLGMFVIIRTRLIPHCLSNLNTYSLDISQGLLYLRLALTRSQKTSEFRV